MTKASDLRVWADALQARQKLPALVRRLIHGTIEKPTLVQFPADEGVQRRGWDGFCRRLSTMHGFRLDQVFGKWEWIKTRRQRLKATTQNALPVPII